MLHVSFLFLIRIQKLPSGYDQEFSDWPYQQQLPLHARATAVQSIRNNFKNTEFQTDPSKHFMYNKVFLRTFILKNIFK